METIIQLVISILTGAIGAFISYEFIEKRRKRLIETYWKIEEEYRSEIQHEARELIGKIEEELKSENLENENAQIKFYNKKYHLTTDELNKKTSSGIRYRIRFLSKIGLLLRKKMVDKDLVFDLIGTGLELDEKTMTTILKAHRDGDNKQDMYQHYEFLYQSYKTWKKEKKFK